MYIAGHIHMYTGPVTALLAQRIDTLRYKAKLWRNKHPTGLSGAD